MSLGREVWLFSTVPWDFALGGRTRHLALELLRLGARVTFVEPPSLKTAVQRLRRPVDAPLDLRLLSPPPTIQRYTDRVPLVPKVHDALLHGWLSLALGDRRPYALVSTPRWYPVLDGLKLGPVFYDCIDDLSVHAEPARLDRYHEWEQKLLGRASGVFAVSPALVDQLVKRGVPNVVLHRNGVPFADFVRRGKGVAHVGKRTVGYVGAIYEWIDVALLEAAAKAHPEANFVLHGPVRRGIDVSALESLPNVRLPGFLPFEEVPKAMAGFDVALIPFKEGVVARAADPIKIYEYFCFGTPVVTTPVGDLERLASSGLVYLASGPEQFSKAIGEALAEDAPGRREHRIAYARENDWSARARTLLETMKASG